MPGHPRLTCFVAAKTWMPGTKPGMTGSAFEPRSEPKGLSLPVIDQHLVAAPADAGAVFFQAGQHCLVTVVHDSAAMTHHVAGAGIVFTLLYLRGSHRGKGNRSKSNNKRKERNKPDHHFSPQSIPPDREINSGIASYQPVHT